MAHDSWAETVRKTIFIVGGLAIVGISFWNTLTHYLEVFWGVSGNFWQTLWTSMYYDVFHEHENLMAAAVFFGATNLVFWGANLFLFVVDLTEKPAFIRQFKIQEEKFLTVDRAKFKHAVKVVCFNNFVLSPLFGLASYFFLRWRGNSFGPELDSFWTVVRDIIICVIVEEFGFYYSHRFVHTPFMYKKVHKQHHEWTAPIGIISIYAHPIEHILSNLTPMIMGPLITGCHITTLTLWGCLGLLNSTNAHCGYHFPGFPSPEAHDYHHYKFNQCFGVLGILDGLHGTDKIFKESTNFKWHYTFFGRHSVKLQHPKDSKTK